MFLIPHKTIDVGSMFRDYCTYIGRDDSIFVLKNGI